MVNFEIEGYRTQLARACEETIKHFLWVAGLNERAEEIKKRTIQEDWEQWRKKPLPPGYTMPDKLKRAAEILEEIGTARGNKTELLAIRRRVNKEFAFSVYHEPKDVLLDAWYHSFSLLEPETHELYLRFVGKVCPFLGASPLARPRPFHYVCTPYYTSFKGLLGEYIVGREGKQLDPEDYIFLYDRNLTSFGSSNLIQVVQVFGTLLEDFRLENGLSLMEYYLKHYKVRDFDRMAKLQKHIAALTREAEDIVRQEKGLPRVGEGWIEETQLYHSLKAAFSDLEVIHHGHPKFLGQQHLDIWFPKLRVGVEYQGEQHVRPVDFFGGEAAYQANLRRDTKKKRLCQENGVHLIYVHKGYSLDRVIEEVKRK